MAKDNKTQTNLVFIGLAIGMAIMSNRVQSGPVRWDLAYTNGARPAAVKRVQSERAKVQIVQDGHALEASHPETKAMCQTHYLVVCVDSVKGLSVEDVAPKYRKVCGKLVKRETLDENTWGYVFELERCPVPFVVWDRLPKDSAQQSVTFKFANRSAFWMPKQTVQRSRRGF